LPNITGVDVFLWGKSPYHCLPHHRITHRDDKMVIIRTTFGEIKLELDAEKAPKTVANFLSYARDGFYDGTIFHRVIDNFMIQGGGFDTDMQQKSAGEPIENEADNGLKNDFGTVAMARTMDPHSATAQFFINVKDNDFLNHSGKNMQGWGYAVFGKVTEGTEVLDKIRAVPTTSTAGHQDVPADPVIIETVEVVEE
jgi:peptidyl-prolyl cis-trans isomerase B (cyclophilin B)